MQKRRDAARRNSAPNASPRRATTGEHFAPVSSVAKRGKAPVVHTEQDSITFVMRVCIRDGYSPRLVLRCERSGGIFVSLRHPFPESHPQTIKERDPH
jgi:hypothetical protein